MTVKSLFLRWPFVIRLVTGALILMSAPVVMAVSAEDVELRFRQLEYGEIVGTTDDYRRNLDELQQLLEPGNREQQGRFYALSCWLQPTDTQELLQTAIETANGYLQEVQGNKQAESDITLCRGSLYQGMSDDVSALGDYNTGLQLATQINDVKLIADALSLRASVEALKGDLAQALEDLQHAQTNYELANIPYWAYSNLSEIANTYRRMGDFQRALTLMEEVEQYYVQRGDEDAINSMRYIRALTLDDLGDHGPAQELYALLLADAYKAKVKPRILTFLIASADSLLQSDKTAQAQVFLAKAEPLLDVDFDPNSFSLWHLFKANADYADEKYEAALAHAQLAEPIMTTLDNYRYLAWVQKIKAKTLAKLTDWQNAYQALTAYNDTQNLLAGKLREQNTTRMRIEFDAARKEVENKTLKAEQTIQQARLQSLEERKRWQALVIALSVILLAVILIWAYRQFTRARLLHKMAMTDELTRLPNRRSIQTKATHAMALAREGATPMSLLVFDVDYFKRINDTWGHEAGDRVLQKIATAAQACMRKNDCVGRTGGEEFMVVLPDAPLERAVEVAQRLCNCIAELDMKEIADDLVVTISLGVAQLAAIDTTLSLLTQRADNALYRAKDSGRNRVEVEVINQDQQVYTQTT